LSDLAKGEEAPIQKLDTASPQDLAPPRAEQISAHMIRASSQKDVEKLSAHLAPSHVRVKDIQRDNIPTSSIVTEKWLNRLALSFQNIEQYISVVRRCSPVVTSVSHGKSCG